MQITVDLNEEQSRRLEELAQSLSVQPAELAGAAVRDLLSRSDEDFRRAANRVLEKNRELYQPLS